MTEHLSRAEWEAQRRQAMDAMPRIQAEVGLPQVLLPYQSATVAKLYESTCRVLLIEKSRRIGLTWGLAAYAVLRAGAERAAGGMDAMYISYSQEMTREFIDACAMWARAFAVAAEAAEEALFDDGTLEGGKSIQAFRIRFASGFEILALSSAPRSLRGKQGVVIIDEAAFVDSLRQLMKAALAFLMWGGQVVVCSTHDGTDNPFNELIQDVLAGRSKYARLRIDFDAALDQGLYRRICLVTGRDWSPEAEAEWRQEIVDFYGEGAEEELFCVPAMGSGAWLPAPLIEARMTAPAPVLRLELPADFLHRARAEQQALMAPFLAELEAALDAMPASPAGHALGFDFGRVADLSVADLLGLEDRLKRVEKLCVEMRGVPGDEQKDVVGRIFAGAMRKGGMIGAAFDATGMGWTLAEDMGRLWGLAEREGDAGLVRPVKFTEEWYRLHMPPLKAAFEDDAIAIAPDPEHLADLRSVKVVRGIARVPPLREGEKGRRRHGDYAIGLALAHYASRQRWIEYGYRAAPPHGRADGRMRDRAEDDLPAGRQWWDPPLGAGLKGGLF